jgi:esterase/lipase
MVLLFLLSAGAGAMPPERLEDLQPWLRDLERQHDDLVPGTERRLRWFRGEVARRPYAIVYVHGYSASRQEIAPLPERLADYWGANLYEARLRGHGRSGEAMLEGSREAWRADLREAMEVGARIGERIVLLSVSTGGTLSTWWAAAGARPAADALVMMSPNFRPRDRRVFMLDWPLLGPLLLRHVLPETRSWEPANEAQARYWTYSYPMRSLLELVRLVREVENLDKAAIRSPTLMLYSTRDQVIDPEAVESVFAEWGGWPKRLTEIDDVGDASQHVLAGDIVSPHGTEPSLEAINGFLRDLGWTPAGG